MLPEVNWRTISVHEQTAWCYYGFGQPVDVTRVRHSVILRLCRGYLLVTWWLYPIGCTVVTLRFYRGYLVTLWLYAVIQWLRFGCNVVSRWLPRVTPWLHRFLVMIALSSCGFCALLVQVRALHPAVSPAGRFSWPGPVPAHGSTQSRMTVAGPMFGYNFRNR